MTKLDLVLYAIKADFFGYAGSVKEISNNKYKVYVDGDTTIMTKTELEDTWDSIDNIEKENIIIEYSKDNGLL